MFTYVNINQFNFLFVFNKINYKFFHKKKLIINIFFFTISHVGYFVIGVVQDINNVSAPRDDMLVGVSASTIRYLVRNGFA